MRDRPDCVGFWHSEPVQAERDGEPFHVSGLPRILAEAGVRGSLAWDDAGRLLLVRDRVTQAETRIRLPLALGELAGTVPIEELAARAAAPLGTQCLVLIQAGATGLGLWQECELLAHKVIKKYVVRGHGKAQGAHLRTRGKSRYGSRLRLQNAERQFEETVAKLREWHDEYGCPERLFVAAGVRTWSQYREPVEAAVEAREPAIRIPIHVHVPGFDELKRVRWWLEHGAVLGVLGPEPDLGYPSA